MSLFDLPGHSTGQNEGLHKLLNRSCIRGASLVTAELVMAVLSVLFYVKNKQRDNHRHMKNKRTVLVDHPKIYGSGDLHVLQDTESRLNIVKDSSNDLIDTVSHWLFF